LNEAYNWVKKTNFLDGVADAEKTTRNRDGAKPNNRICPIANAGFARYLSVLFLYI
jgi:hypothetical protein